MGRANGTQTWHVAMALSLIIGGISVMNTAYCQCTPPEVPSADLETPNRIRIQWQYPLCEPAVLTDTISHYTGDLSGRFRVQGTESEEVAAVRLPGLPPGATVNRVRTFVSGNVGATREDWRSTAGLWCSLHWDSSGYPGSQVGHSHYWPVGDHDSLYAGGWYEDMISWAVDNADTTDLWLAIHWFPGTAAIVVLGSDETDAPDRLVVGIGSNPVWVTLYQPGLFIETETSYPSEPAPAILTRTVSVTRDAQSPSGANITERVGTVPVCEGWFVDDSLPMAHNIRYGLVVDCDTLYSDTSWTAGIETPPAINASVSPSYQSLVIAQGERETLSVRLLSDDPDSLYLNVLQVDTSGWEGGPQVSITPDCEAMAPYGAIDCELVVDAEAANAGFYATELEFGLVDGRTGDVRALSILFEVLVDQRTDVREERTRSPVSQWQILPVQNPFADQIVVQITPGGRLTPSGPDASVGIEWGADAEILVYNLIGEIIARDHFPLAGSEIAAGGHIIRVGETTDWPSGVYICRARIGRTVHSVKLVHVK